MTEEMARRMQEAQENHWGIYCGEWNTCQKYGLCRVECPCGGTPAEDVE